MLYEVITKFASIFGPLLFAALVHLSGSNRLAILALTSFFIVGLAILARVDITAGTRHALQAHSTESESQRHRSSS